MRTIGAIFVSLMTGGTLVVSGKALLQEDANAVITRAIAAHGGSELLNKYPAVKIKAKGCMTASNISIPFTVVHSFQAPDKVRLVQNYFVTGPPTIRTAVVKSAVVSHCKMILQIGDKIRLFVDNKEVTPIPPDEAASIRNALHVQNICRLLPLLNSTVYKLNLVEEVKVCDRPAIGVKVVCSGQRDVTLYFDKSTGLLVKSEYIGLDASKNRGLFEEIYMNYKDVRGVFYPSRTEIMVNGQRHAYYEVVEFLPLEKFDPAEFTEP